MYSTADMPASRLIGRWQQEGGFGAMGDCTPRGIEFSIQNGMVQSAYHLCLNGRGVQGAGPLAGGQGRYQLPGLAAPIWVLWMDGGNRSMAIGTPDGSFGLVLSKQDIPADRMIAAREILAWNGYDLAQFVRVP
jgi:apolipoprotein D and lipocalin family protein